MLLPFTKKKMKEEKTLEGTHEMKTKKNECEWEKGHFSHYFSQLSLHSSECKHLIFSTQKNGILSGRWRMFDERL